MARTLETVFSWMAEGIRGLPGSLADPEYGGAVLAVLLLVLLYSIASSVRRLKRRVEQLSSELSAMRSILKKIEWGIGRIEEKRAATDRERKTIFNLPLQEDLDKTEWK